MTLHLCIHFCSVDAALGTGHIACTTPVVSMAGCEADSHGSASAFLKESAEWPFGPRSGQESPTLGANRSVQKSKHPACAGCLKKKGVFDVGALLPQFLAELTSTLNSRIWNYGSMSACLWQA